jgi:hypothetical protein
LKSLEQVLIDTGEVEKKIPEFRSEDEEFEFWSKVDSTEYLDWSKAGRFKLINLKPTLNVDSSRNLNTRHPDDQREEGSQRPPFGKHCSGRWRNRVLQDLGHSKPGIG